MSHWHDDWLPADLCKDLCDDDCDCKKKRRRDWDDDCGCDGRKRDRKDDLKDFRKDDCDCQDDWLGKKRKKRKAIQVGRVTVDCTPVAFRTPGQAVNIVSCPVTQALNVPVTRQVNVQVPLGFSGCVLNVPVTERVQVPVVTTVNLPPVLIPSPSIVCPSVVSSIRC